MGRGSRIVVAAALTLLSVPIVVVNGVLYDRVGVEAVAVWLVLESLFLTLTGVVVIRLPVTHAETGVSGVTKRHYQRSQRVRAAYRTLRREGASVEARGRVRGPDLAAQQGDRPRRG